MKVEFTVVGNPAPKGSARAMVRNGHAIYVPGGSAMGAEKLRSWSSEVALQAAQAMEGRPILVGRPLRVGIVFHIPRPKGHFGKDSLRRHAPIWVSVKPDLDKLLRATLDAMTGLVFDDDCRIAVAGVSKRYCWPGGPPGAEITVQPLEEDE